MNGIEFWPIIKWILIVLAAAFIGQFGRVFANYLVERIKSRKTADAAGKTGEPTPLEQLPDPDRPESPADRTDRDAKAEKKALKALVKLRKKEKEQK